MAGSNDEGTSIERNSMYSEDEEEKQRSGLSYSFSMQLYGTMNFFLLFT
jgi:hypothetical protein